MLLSERTISALPLSIGTSLALESIFEARGVPYDLEREIPERVDYRKYNSLWINVETLIRNFIGSLSPAYKNSIDVSELVASLGWEMEVIKTIVKEDTNSSMRLVYYTNNYSAVINNPLLPNTVKFRLPSTPKQHLYEKIVKDTIKLLTKNTEIDIVSNKLAKLNPTDDTNMAIVLTHHAYDLLSWKSFKKLDLIESHTGKLKRRQDWYSKYYSVGKEDISMLPFQRKLFFIFGDNTLVHPMNIGFRTIILEIARNRNFTPLTEEDKVTFYLDIDIKERYLFETYKRL